MRSVSSALLARPVNWVVQGLMPQLTFFPDASGGRLPTEVRACPRTSFPPGFLQFVHRHLQQIRLRPAEELYERSVGL